MLYKDSFDGVRFLCFLAVFGFHFDIHTVWFGVGGLSSFLVLSGFVVTYVLVTAMDGSSLPTSQVILHFYARRALRTLPAYALFLVVLAVLGDGRFMSYFLSLTWNLKLFELSLGPDFPSVTGGFLTNGLHLWSICLEEQFYLLFPWALAIDVRARRRVPYVLIGLLVMSMVARLAMRFLYARSWMGVLLPISGEYLLFGSLMSFLVQRKVFESVRHWARRSVELAIVLFLAYAVFKSANLPGLQVQYAPNAQTVYAALTALLLVCLWKDESSWIQKLLCAGPLPYLGKISYGLYLYHCLALHYAKLWLAAYEAPALTMTVAFVLTLAAASFSFHFLEMPLNRLRHRFPYFLQFSNS